MLYTSSSLYNVRSYEELSVAISFKKINTSTEVFVAVIVIDLRKLVYIKSTRAFLHFDKVKSVVCVTVTAV